MSDSQPPSPVGDETRALSVPGEMIRARYRVERVLGRGGMGEVLLAEDTLLHRRVALKRLRSDGDEAVTRRAAILKEARRASQVSDPRIAAIYDVLDGDADVLIVMEYVEGVTLRTRMTAPFPLAEFWDVATQCVEAVGAAHARGIIHRDIKPENLMLTPGGGIKILDFGIARRPDTPEGTAADTVATTMTVDARGPVIAGTPQYMAPEAHYGGRLDVRTDLFSLGTVFYELVTGTNPFAAPTLQGVVDRVMTHVPPPASERNAEIPPALAGVIATMMAKDPARRQTTSEEVLRGLEAAHRTAPVAGRDATTIEPAHGRRRGRRAAAAVGLVAAAATVAWLMLRWTAGHALPADRNVAVLTPVTAGASDDFAHFAVGATDLLSQRLQKHQTEPGFQLVSFTDVVDEHVHSAADARKILGANLALVPALEQTADALRAQLQLWDTARASIITTRVVEAPIAQPFQFLDRVYREAAGMLGLRVQPGNATSEWGVRGAGTLRFLLQGIGRLRAADTAAEAVRAVDDLELARRAEPEAASVLAWLSGAQRRSFTLSNDRQWLVKAEASAREATTRDSSRAEGFRHLGLVLLLKKDDRGALAAFDRARSLNATDDDIYPRLGSVYGRLGQWDAQRSLYDSVIARRPHCWQPYWWLGSAEFRRGRVPEAIQAYRAMVLHAPAFYRSYSNLGGALVLIGEYPAAIDTLQRSIALRPTKSAFDNLGTAYFNSGRVQESADSYNQALQFGFAEYDSWINLGEAYYFLRNRKDQAVDAFGQAIRLGRELMVTRSQQGKSVDPMIPANLATVFPKLDRPDSARTYMMQALAADSANAMVQYCAALTCWQLGEQDRAVRWLERAVDNGYPVAWIRDSPIFREWNRRQDFHALLARADAESPGAEHP